MATLGDKGGSDQDSAPAQPAAGLQGAVPLHELALSLARARDQLAIFVENAPAAIAMFDGEMRYLAASRRWREDYGLTGETAGRSHYDLFPEIPEHWRLVHRECLAGAASHSEGERFVRENGTVQWLRWDVRPWRDAAGAIGGIIISSEDITEVRATADYLTQAEKALTARAAELRQTMDTAAIGLTRLDREMRYLSANPAYSKIAGRPVERIVGATMPDVLGPAAFERVRPLIARVLDGETVEYEEELPWRDARPAWIHAIYTPWREADGSVGGWVASIEDVTTRKRAEQALAASEQRLAVALDAAAAGVFEWNVESNAVEWTTNHFRLLGLEPGCEPPSYDLWRRHVHTEDIHRIEAALREAVETGAPYSQEYRVSGADGRERWLLGQGLFLQAPGTPKRMIGAIVDITERKHKELALEEAAQQKDRFLATLSHELRNPLAPIRTAAQILAAPKLEPGQLAHARQVIQRQVGHMAVLLDDLMDLARITQGKLEIRPQAVPLTSVIEAAVEAARPLIDAKSHGLEIKLRAATATLRADLIRVTQILTNLLTNAAKYTDAGGRILLEAAVEASAARISVTDTGIGLTPQQCDKVFEMFAQVEDAKTRSQAGLGIGLALVKALAELHGGGVEVASDGPGRGSTFTVRLPLEAAPAADRIAARADPPSPMRILVTDDNRDAADSLAMLLELGGHELRVAYSGAAALDLAESFRPHAALLDIGMPSMDGYALARALRRQLWAGDLYLVALTGWGQEADRLSAHEAGFDHHVTKPVDPEAIEEILLRAVARKAELQ